MEAWLVRFRTGSFGRNIYISHGIMTVSLDLWRIPCRNPTGRHHAFLYKKDPGLAYPFAAFWLFLVEEAR